MDYGLTTATWVLLYLPMPLLIVFSIISLLKRRSE
ncbi:hypothetical protein BkAM31D_02080 [Halalkalibacter krulwichiae]|uniref:Uncharacterized protein n=1 Tax=Halalkalibacter krulwichiae TaxID=199441 RepID=A0A1Y9THI5_9BACI|nr:hypothetical protein BkAM31D_02080 [Halalkalibacter krulwichiae]